MSATEASRIYELIVETVINEVREDFENTGVDEQTLQDLKRNWKIKLSETNVAKFSWDTEGAAAAADDDPMQQHPELMVKQEEEPALMLSTDENSNNNNNDNTNNDDDNNSNGANVATGQISTDAVPTHNEETTNEVRVKPDPEGQTNMLNIQSLNGEELPQGARITIGLELNGDDVDTKPAVAGDDVRTREKQAKRSALLDTDEVGSELDDSDDDYLISEGEEDGPDENMMLCLYEKVTRTKARWKCSLKDGIVTINRKDYTFQKAQVEAEWV